MKEKQTWIGVIIIIIIILAVWYFGSGTKSVTAPVSTATTTVDSRVQVDSASPLDVRNATYKVEGLSVTLVDGVSQQAIPNSSSFVKTTILEGPAFADLNGDNIKDAVVILRQETGGSGIFYYTTSLLSNGNSSTGNPTNAVLLGDRIRIRSIEINQGTISIVVLERKDGDPFSVTPTVEKTLQFTSSDGTLVKAQ